MASKIEGSFITRYRHSAVALVIGFLLIANISLALLYLRQVAKQSEINEKIVSQSRLLSIPLPSDRELQTEYNEVKGSLSSIKGGKEAFDIIVGIAKDSGIDVSPKGGKLIIPSFEVKKEKIGGGTYEVLSFKGIMAQGDQNSLMAFISNLDSGKTLKTMVLKEVLVNLPEVKAGAKEGAKIDAAVTIDVDIYYTGP